MEKISWLFIYLSAFGISEFIMTKYLNDYEITPEFSYELDGDNIKTIEKPWQINDDNNQPSYSLMPPPVVVSLIKQLAEALNLTQVLGEDYNENSPINIH